MNNDEDVPKLPPPTYEEAISTNYSQPQNSPQPPLASSRPPIPTHIQRTDGGSSSSSSYSNYVPTPPPRPSSSNSATQDLYTANPNLPFKFPRGFLCPKCKNSGYKISNGKICRDCWKTYYLKNNAYNPNPQLTFRYPKNYLCEKCSNTGYKHKNGMSCQDCWELFSPRNNVRSGYSVQSPMDSFFGMGQSAYLRPAPQVGPWGWGPPAPAPPPLRVPPGDPRLGGVLCGRCRGSGLIHTFLLDDELCNVCHGLGRVIHGPPQGGYYVPGQKLGPGGPGGPGGHHGYGPGPGPGHGHGHGHGNGYGHDRKHH
ncbi:hypothetical protein DFJ63DRAFT_162173 [Scheffersomyces coipomensis]|uniref:uncharacterized protein n=1 Tax=Scheffersomyces coipomensis TaxID=1788519 RepID=UPI00315D4E60